VYCLTRSAWPLIRGRKQLLADVTLVVNRTGSEVVSNRRPEGLIGPLPPAPSPIITGGMPRQHMRRALLGRDLVDEDRTIQSANVCLGRADHAQLGVGLLPRVLKAGI
jgi:hypothetical protein